MKILFRLCFLLIVIASLSACGKGGCNVVPSVNVYHGFSQATNPSLFVTGGADVIDGIGVTGVIVYNMGNGEFIAYDRCSTVNPEKRNRVVLDKNNPYVATDPVSGAEWLLLDGSPAKIAECPLKPYYVRKVGNLYYIQN
ncbi:hypothetical protein [Sphingobacterium sp. SYP-B4668]|uniref:hypothetical protein n=1 Tax=Sphingobacterium sp. SYP-B4668 TaxID=2996035 RepID=UPI0022DDDB7E|nr:hypothetical protein [Sphingobacterium sp. SYP-B4668]